MREIKFRVWNEFRMLSDEELRISARELYSEVGKSGQYEGCILIPNCEDLEVMQYTGLKDKNGIEIYEGDIVHNEGWLGETKLKDDIIGEVIFSNGCFLIKTRYGNKYLYAGTNKVIGNIYENKYLLEDIE